MPDPIRARATPWTAVILLCGKCARKMKGGYGADGGETLRAALKVELRAGDNRRATRVVETRCLGLCPKKAVAALNATRPGCILAIPKGTSAREALAQLGPPPAGP